MNPTPRKVQLIVGAGVATLLLVVLVLAVTSFAGWKSTPQGVANDLDRASQDMVSAASQLEAKAKASEKDVPAQMAATQAVYVRSNATVFAALAELRQLALAPSAVDLSHPIANLTQVSAFFSQWAHVYDNAVPTSVPQAVGVTRAMAEAASGAASDIRALPAPTPNDYAAITDALFGPQVIPFEVLGILLTAVMFGALITARPMTVHGDEETSIIHPNLSPSPAHVLPASDAPAVPATEVQP